MGQRDTLRGMDRRIHAAMLSAGMADAAAYVQGTAEPVNCRVYVDQSASQFGDVAAVVGQRTLVTILREDVDEPVRNARVIADGITWLLSEKDASDQSMTRWVATRA